MIIFIKELFSVHISSKDRMEVLAVGSVLF